MPSMINFIWHTFSVQYTLTVLCSVRIVCEDVSFILPLAVGCWIGRSIIWRVQGDLYKSEKDVIFNTCLSPKSLRYTYGYLALRVSIRTICVQGWHVQSGCYNHGAIKLAW